MSLNPNARQSIFLYKMTVLGELCCIALPFCCVVVVLLTIIWSDLFMHSIDLQHVTVYNISNAVHYLYHVYVPTYTILHTGMGLVLLCAVCL